MSHYFRLLYLLTFVLISSVTLVACDSNSDDDGPHDDVVYVRISIPGEQFYAASDTRAISPILVAVNAEYEVQVDFVTEDGYAIDYDGYTYQVTVDDAIATFTPTVRDGEFFGTVKGIELGETEIAFRLRRDGRDVWTSARAELKVVQ